MKRATILGLLVGTFVLQSAWAVYTQTSKPPGPLRTERVKGDLHMIAGEGGNVALYATSDGVILVDDMFDRNHADILAQVKTVTDKPLKYASTRISMTITPAAISRCCRSPRSSRIAMSTRI